MKRASSRCVRVSIAALIACAAPSVATRVHAQAAPGFAIAVRAPAQAECTSAEQLTEQVVVRTGRSAPTAQSGETLSVAVEVAAQEQAQGFRALVTVADERGRARGQRELTTLGPCSTLDEMLVLVIASSVGVSAEPRVAPQLPRPPSPPPQPELEPEPQPARDSAPIVISADLPSSDRAASASAAERSGASTPWRFDLEASGRVLTGTVPDAGLAVGGALFVEHGALGLRAAGAWLPRSTARTALPLRLGGGFGELGLCGRAAHGSTLALLFCAAAQAGALHAATGALWRQTPRWDGLLQLAPSVTARARLLPGAGFALALGAAIPLLFPRYGYRSAAGDEVPLHHVELGLFAELALWIRLNP